MLESPNHIIKVVDYCDNPFISIVTRHLKGRENRLIKNIESLNEQTLKNFEQILIIDNVGLGLYEANKSFSLIKDMVRGRYVYGLDDDDFLCNNDFTKIIQEESEKNNFPDVIVVRVNIVEKGLGKNHNIDWDYILPKKWKSVPEINDSPGGSYIVKKEIYQKYISNFGAKRAGDFYFIDSIWKTNPSVIWIDKIMARAEVVSNGKIL